MQSGQPERASAPERHEGAITEPIDDQQGATPSEPSEGATTAPSEPPLPDPGEERHEGAITEPLEGQLLPDA